MKAFVTGGAGYIGSVASERLLRAGWEVDVWDNLSEGHRAAVPSGARLIQGDLEDRAGLAQAMKELRPDAVVHFAASTMVGESMRNPGKYFANNLSNGILLLEAMVGAGVKKLVFSSTCATYGVPAQVPITEETPHNPENPYGESKAMFERVVRWYTRIHGMEAVGLRYFNAAGAMPGRGEDHRIETHLIPRLLQVALGKVKECELFGTDYPTPDGTCIRDYIHVEDLAEAHLLALKRGVSGFYNIGTGKGWSVREVIRACEEVVGRRIAVAERPRRAGDPPILVACADKAREALGWSPKHMDIREIVRTAWEWHSSHPDGYGD